MTDCSRPSPTNTSHNALESGGTGPEVGRLFRKHHVPCSDFQLYPVVNAQTFGSTLDWCRQELLISQVETRERV